MSTTGRIEVVQMHIRMRVSGLGWDDLYHLGQRMASNILATGNASKTKIFPQEPIQIIPEFPSVNGPSCIGWLSLGTLAPEIIKLDKVNNSKQKEFKEGLGWDDLYHLQSKIKEWHQISWQQTMHLKQKSSHKSQFKSSLNSHQSLDLLA